METSASSEARSAPSLYPTGDRWRARARIDPIARRGDRDRPAVRRREEADRGDLPWLAGAHRGRRVSFYPALAPKVRAAGGEYADIPLDAAASDGNLITAPAWPAHAAWLAQFLKVLGMKTTA